MFRDRAEAGQKLAAELAKLALPEPIVLALPCGGVPVAAQIAKALHAPLDLVIVGKVGAPGNPELAVAAIIDGNPPDVVLNREIIEAYELSDEELDALVKAERPELEQRRRAFRGGRQARSISNKTAILVDDGAATGTTMKVAVRAMKRRGSRQVVVALPVAPAEIVNELRQDADCVVCLLQSPDFRALSLHYIDFREWTDEQVRATIEEVRQARYQEKRHAKGIAESDQVGCRGAMR